MKPDFADGGGQEIDDLKTDAAFLNSVLASSSDCIKVLDLDGKLIYMTDAGQNVMEVSDFNAIRGCPWPDFWQGQGNLDAIDAVKAARAGGVGMFQGQAFTMAGNPRYWDVRVTPIIGVDGRPERLLSVSRDITVTQRAEEALRQSEAHWRGLFEKLHEGFILGELIRDAAGAAVDWRYLDVNPAWGELVGLSSDAATGRTIREVFPGIEDEWIAEIAAVVENGRASVFERQVGSIERWYEGHAFPLEGDRFAILFLETTRRKQSELELHELNATLETRVAAEVQSRALIEEALRQSQKMEAVGQLTGGLAHDFNNLLAGISGSLELINARINQGRSKDVDKYVVAAQGAVKRAAALTHRLLAFSRRQTLAPKPTNVNALVGGLLDLIQRTVGPSIEIENLETAGLWSALIDPSQLENALLNLCINARDAMPGGGKITIETANHWVDRAGAIQHDMREGPYLSLCVSDNGTGMPPNVIARAFDPFFTTKPLGEGTGLGLSMIYGFARQSGGQVHIASEVGEGTTICIYLPRFMGEADDDEIAPASASVSGAKAGETVLIVDDEPTVRMLIADVLDDLGYSAIEASDGAGGLSVIQSDVRIDLLVTDVGLPGGINGRQLADAARVSRPDLKILFITGFAEKALLTDGQLEPGMSVLTKPFALDTLAARVRDLIADLHPRNQDMP